MIRKGYEASIDSTKSAVRALDELHRRAATLGRYEVEMSSVPISSISIRPLIAKRLSIPIISFILGAPGISVATALKLPDPLVT